MRIDLTGVEDRSFEVLPAGRYLVKLVDYKMQPTKGGDKAKLPAGTPMINWETDVVKCLSVNNKSLKPEDVKCENRKLWTNSIIHKTTMFQIKRLLTATGIYDPNDLEGDLDIDPDEIVQKAEAMIAVVSDDREYNGEKQNDIKRFIGLHEVEDDKGTPAETSLLP